MPGSHRPLAYLAGAIEQSADGGRGWRRDLSIRLNGLGHRVFDPTENEQLLLSEEERLNFRAWKRSDLERFQQTVRRIIARDLDVITNEADYVVCYWDESAVRGAGTQAEITFAHRLGKPVYLVAAMPHAQMSGWVLGCASRIFDDFEALHRFLAGRAG